MSVRSINDETIPEEQQLNQPEQHSSEDYELTELEKVIDKVGGQGRYQLFSFIIFCCVWFFSSWTLVGQSFFFDDSYTCKSIADPKKCEEYICSLPQDRIKEEIQWHSLSMTFAFSEYMICDLNYLPTVFISIFYFGSLVGYFIIPAMADNRGRKIAMLISWGIYGIGVLITLFAFHPALLGIGQFLAGFGCNPAITLCYSFINEQCLRKVRQLYCVAIQIFIALGECVIGLLFLPHITWRYVFLILLVFVILTFISLFYLLETPKFCFSRNKEQTLKILNEMAKRNRRQRVQLQQLTRITVQNEENGSSMLDLFRYKSLRSITFACGIIFLGIQVIYYSTLLNLNNAGFGKLLNQEIIGISQAFSYIATQFFIDKVKRKKISFIFMGIASLFCFLITILQAFQTENNSDTIKILSTICLIVDRFFLCSFWSIFYVYLAQLYPTRVRSLGFGWASAVGMIGSVFAPYMILFAEDGGINTWIFPGVIGLIAVISIFFLPETFRKALQDQIEEKRMKNEI